MQTTVIAVRQPVERLEETAKSVYEQQMGRSVMLCGLGDSRCIAPQRRSVLQ